MPRLSVWMIRLALIHLLGGFAIGALLLAHKGVPFLPAGAVRLRPMHVELLTLGWTMNLAMGVAYWILPRRGSDGARGGGLVVAACVLLNAAVLLVGFGQLAGGGTPIPLAGKMAEAGAAALFAVHAWGRLRPSVTEGGGRYR